MELLNVEKKYGGKFINYYDATYRNKIGGLKTYEMVSRDPNLTKDKLGKGESAAVTIIAFNKDKTKILLNKEFRMPMNTEIFNFPCGLIDKGEDSIMAAARELKEETGLDFIELVDKIPPAFSAIGFADELLETIICIADGNFAPSTSYDEEIEANWYSKEDIKTMLQTEKFAARTQLYLYLWANN